MKKQAQTVIALLLVGVVFSAAGCSPTWKRKFVRARVKKSSAPQPIFSLLPEQEAAGPPAIRYQERFAYWKSWHSELLNSIGEIRKRDIRYLDGAIGELGSMTGLLREGPEKQRLNEIITELAQLRDTWNKRDGYWMPLSKERTRLQQLGREIDKKFHYSKVKQSVPEAVPAAVSVGEKPAGAGEDPGLSAEKSKSE